MNEDQRKAFAAALGIPEDERLTLDAGGNHDFNCRCATCARWWALMGPQNFEDADQPGWVPDYGPFTAAEIQPYLAETKEGDEE